MRKSKLSKLDTFVSLSRQRSVQILMGVGFLYILLVTLEIPFVFKTESSSSSVSQDHPITRSPRLASKHNLEQNSAPTRPLNRVNSAQLAPSQLTTKNLKILSNLSFDVNTLDPGSKDGSLELHRTAKTAWLLGLKLWQGLETGKLKTPVATNPEKKVSESCPHSISLSGSEFSRHGSVVVLPCGLTLGSHVTVVGKPRRGHGEKEPRIALVKVGQEPVMVSQFMMELQGLKTVEGEEPPRVLHFNPRLKGDWSGKPVIEQNTCYRQQWGAAVRCEGWKSKADEETSK